MHHGQNRDEHKKCQKNVNFAEIRGKFIYFVEIRGKFIKFEEIGGIGFGGWTPMFVYGYL